MVEHPGKECQSQSQPADLQIKHRQHLGYAHSMVGRHVAQNAFEGPNLDRTVIGDDLVVFAARLRCYPQVGTALTRDDLT